MVADQSQVQSPAVTIIDRRAARDRCRLGWQHYEAIERGVSEAEFAAEIGRRAVSESSHERRLGKWQRHARHALRQKRALALAAAQPGAEGFNQ